MFALPPNSVEELEKNKQLAEDRKPAPSNIKRPTKKERRRLKGERKQDAYQGEQHKKYMNFRTSIFLLVLIGILFLGGWFVLQGGGDFDTSKSSEILISESSGTLDVDKYPPSITIVIDGIKLNVDVAETAEEKAVGLSGRESLAEEEAMLFVYETPRLYSFWMKDMNFPIDIIWIDEDMKVIDIAENIQPESFPKKFTPKKKAQYVVEVNAGWVEEHMVHVGSPVSLQNAKEEIAEVADTSKPFAPASDFLKQATLPKKVLFDVPFTPQAVFGNWDDVRQSNACEEASALMAMRWVEGRNLPLVEAEREVIAISNFELEKYGHFHDTSVEDTVTRIFKDYFKYEGVSVRYNIGVDDIKSELDRGNLVIVPSDGRKLGNPYYTQPGPPLHMLVIRGYDDATREFITNDPGTKRGEAYRYDYRVFENAIADYPSGYNEPGSREKTAMIIVRPR